MKRTFTLLLALTIFVSSFAGNLIPVHAAEGKTIVALDAGHDSKHAGSVQGGLYEHELTLKIAYYCKAELEKHEDIEVYMTRTSADCPYPNAANHARCIDERMLAAKRAGADYYISLHLNAEEKGTSVNGVEVIYPNSSWKPDNGKKGELLAQYIKNELTAIGLNDRGIYSKDTSINERYPDGSLSDYYTVHIDGKQNDIPSVIVEQAFLTNASDRENFLSSEEGLKKLGTANAKGIAKMLGKHGGWEQVGSTWYYYIGNVLQTGWLYDAGYWYYLGDNGAMQTGWAKAGEDWYYLDEEGRMQTGWIRLDGTWYYLNQDGSMQTGWLQDGVSWYYFDNNGAMQTGWTLVEGKWYYLNQSGVMQTGWIQLKGEWYYLNVDGSMQTGWKTINGTKYLFDSNGEIMDGAHSFIIDVSQWQGKVDWNKVANTEVDGVILRCGHGDETTETNGQWKDKYYESYLAEVKRLGLPYGIYFYNTAKTVEQARKQAQNAVAVIKASGANPTLPVYVDIEEAGGECDLVAIAKVYMEEFVANGYKAGIYANANYWTKYLNDPMLNIYYRWIAAYGPNNGAPTASFKPEDGFDKYMMWQYTSQFVLDGITENTVDCNVMFTWHNKPNGWNRVANSWFYYENGYLAHNWRYIGNTWYYFANSGVMISGWVFDKDDWYYMGQDGSMRTGWNKIDGTWYYMNASGAMQTGWQFLGGTWYYMDASGAMATGWRYVGDKWYYMDASGAMQTGWEKVDGTWYYMNGSGAMQTGWLLDGNTWYYMDASGAMATGWRYVGDKWYHMDANGAMQTGWIKLSGTWYYLNASGAMLTGSHVINGTLYHLDQSGAWIN